MQSTRYQQQINKCIAFGKPKTCTSTGLENTTVAKTSQLLLKSFTYLILKNRQADQKNKTLLFPSIMFQVKAEVYLCQKQIEKITSFLSYSYKDHKLTIIEISLARFLPPSFVKETICLLLYVLAVRLFSVTYFDNGSALH